MTPPLGPRAEAVPQELQFKAEDCDVTLPGNVKVMSPERANRLLAARLDSLRPSGEILLKADIEKAPEVFGFNTGSTRRLWDTDSGTKDTHRACLVCIEPLKEKK